MYEVDLDNGTVLTGSQAGAENRHRRRPRPGTFLSVTDGCFGFTEKYVKARNVPVLGRPDDHAARS